MIELRAGSALCGVSAEDGGRVASLRVDRTTLIVERDPALPVGGWGSYPMVPWAGRVRRGRFRFDGIEYRLPINFGPHAIHGTGFQQSWEIVDRSSDSCTLTCPLQWEFGGEAEQIIELADDALTCTLAVRAGERAMPATIGWHPWFIKPTHADLRFERMYPRDDDFITDGSIAEPPPPGPWDDCFAGPIVTPTLWIQGTGTDALEVSVTSDCDYWVVYDMPVHATCVEPQTATPDAFNLGGATRLEPGQELRRSMTIHWMPAARTA